jgi:hypothetical protein
VDVARVFLNTAPEDRSGEDRSLVVVQVSAENLARNVPAGTSEARPAGVDPVGCVPAGTSSPESAVCHIDGVGSIEPATAQRLACDNPLLGAVIDEHGEVLAGPYPSSGEQGATPRLDDPGQDVPLSRVSSDPASGCSSRDPMDSGWPYRSRQFDLVMQVASHRGP